MLMDLRYVLKGLLLPPFTQVVVLLMVWKIRKRAPAIAKALFLIAVCSLWLLGTPVVATFLARSLEKYSALGTEQLGIIKADAIVILSAGQNVYAPEFGEPVSGAEQLVRIRYGAFLQKKTGLPVLVSGGSVQGGEPRSLAETMAFDLLKGYDVQVRWLEKESRTTAENSRYSYALLAQENKTTVLLVTSAIHMMRAKWSFEQAGFKVLPAPTNFRDRRSLNINSFMPNAGALMLSSEALHEWLGYWAYQLLEDE
ncbi:YdcF family protein [Desulfogranum marinum]|uniref:YdcF family protein n=1 Tax=Desulfogranum marinum TaxID=453220 RepID=UPI0019638B95|nr:YdcF family protein [Desulfogranum marinum]MBM9510921.1 YdcF family protein [Desulfogranum marinum]